MKRNISVYQLTTCALMAALMCILGPMAIPIGPVPVSFTNLVIYLAVYLLGMKGGTVSYAVYLLLGAAGLPVFSGWQGGLGKLAGPTGGYLVGFVLMALLSGFALEKFRARPVPTMLGMAAGTLVAYLFGTVWFVLQMQCAVWHPSPSASSPSSPLTWPKSSSPPGWARPSGRRW